MRRRRGFRGQSHTAEPARGSGFRGGLPGGRHVRQDRRTECGTRVVEWKNEAGRLADNGKTLAGSVPGHKPVPIRRPVEVRGEGPIHYDPLARAIGVYYSDRPWTARGRDVGDQVRPGGPLRRLRGDTEIRDAAIREIHDLEYRRVAVHDGEL